MTKINIDIGDMNAFVTIAEMKNISEAARKLNYLQSNFSLKIKKLENHYNCQLFERSQKGVELTNFGLFLYQKYKKILFTWEETENEITKQEKSLKFGTHTSIGGHPFSNSLKKLCENYPDLSITLKTGSTAYLERELLLGNINLAYVFSSHNSKNIHYIQETEEELVLIGGLQLSQQLLLNSDIFTLSPSCLYTDVLKKLFTAYGLEARDFTEVNDMETIVELTRLGMGISVVPLSFVARYRIDHYSKLPEKYRFIKSSTISNINHELTLIEKQFIHLNNTL